MSELCSVYPSIGSLILSASSIPERGQACRARNSAVRESGVSLMSQIYSFLFHHAIIAIKLAVESRVAT